MSGVAVPKKTARKKKAERASTHKEAATRLHSLIVRSLGRCEAAGMYGLDCSDTLNACHIIRRSRSGVRTDLSNSFCACTTHHAWLDNHIADLIDFVGGSDRYRELQTRADIWTERRGSPLLYWREERARLSEIAKQKGLI